MRRSIKILAAASAVAMPALAGAQSVQFVGATRGCFYTGLSTCVPAGTFGSGSVALTDGVNDRVIYNFGSFNVYTQPSAPPGPSGAGIGGAGQNYGTAQVPVLATPFTVPANTYLRIEFMITGPTLGGATPYFATRSYRVIGSVGTNANDGGPTFQSRYATEGDIYVGAFTNGNVQGGGTASGTVIDFTYDNNNTTTGQLSPFTGRVDIVASAVPEPATVALMGTGLLALAGMGYARRRNDA